VYAVPVHWVWSDDGFLSAWNARALLSTGVIDFAGSGLVHMVGGVAGLVGSVLLGPRLGRFPSARLAEARALRLMLGPRDALTRGEAAAAANDLRAFRGHNHALAALGVYCLWFGWFGFNAGCTGGLSGGGALVAARVVLNTVIAPSCGALAAVLVTKARRGVWSLPSTINGLLAGLVGITGPCAVVGAGGAAAVGGVSGAIYCAGAVALDRACVDDPVEAIAIHAFPGAWGVVASGLFARASLVADAGLEHASAGVLFGGPARQLLAQLFGTLAIFAWTCLASAAVFLAGHLATVQCGNASGLRVTAETELRGLDATKHGGSAFNFFPAEVVAMLHGVHVDEKSAGLGATELAQFATHASVPTSDEESKA
jgi:Amt family ammonium transporter